MSETAETLGRKLKSAREQRGASAQKMADDLHLDGWVIEALEAGDYERIGPSVYARGYLRKYASILGVLTGPEEPKVVPAAARAPVPIVRIDPPSRTDSFWPKVGGVAAFVLVAGGIAWWRPWHRGASSAVAPPAAPTASSEVAPEAQAPNAAASAAAALAAGDAAPSAESPMPAEEGMPAGATLPGADESPAAAERKTAAPSSGAARSIAAAAVRGVAGEGATPSPGAQRSAATAAAAGRSAQDLTPGVGRAHLRLSFSADSRVDVYDYAGKVIFSGNGRANSVKTLAGTAPFRVRLGSASGVQLELNDRAVAIGRQFVSGDVARFEAGADGVLRRDTRASSTDRVQSNAASPRG